MCFPLSAPGSSCSFPPPPSPSPAPSPSSHLPSSTAGTTEPATPATAARASSASAAAARQRIENTERRWRPGFSMPFHVEQGTSFVRRGEWLF